MLEPDIWKLFRCRGFFAEAAKREAITPRSRLREDMGRNPIAFKLPYCLQISTDRSNSKLHGYS
jgi:hypothetical protein